MRNAELAGIEPYRGPWTANEARHLLRRATYGANYQQVQAATAAGLTATLDELLRPLPAPPPPLATDANRDAPVGETWVNRPYRATSQRARNLSLASFLSGLILHEGVSLRETMVLFWHNHFAVRGVNDPRTGYFHLALLRSRAFGNFRELTKAITVDPAMLRFLNGNANRAVAPNENYARELLELFTVGKGPQIGEGDYSNYTEGDIREIARALTGWVVRGNRNAEIAEIYAEFLPNRHDGGEKQLSYHFDNAVIGNGGAEEYRTVVDLIFEQEAVSHYLVRKLYRYFVYYDIPASVEASVIEPLAALFRDSDYEIAPVLRALLGSAHFFELRSQGPMIKNPVDFVYQLFRTLEIDVTADNPADQELANYRLLLTAGLLGMSHLNPPSVAGWKAYYQEPLYYRQWINSNTLRARTQLTETLAARGYVPIRRLVFPLDLLGLIDQFPEPGNLTAMITELAALLLPRPLTDGQIDFLKDLVIPGLPDTQWAVEYAAYRADPTDAGIIAALETKLRRSVRAVLTMPEYQLS